jgi:hypothetical protein
MPAKAERSCRAVDASSHAITPRRKRASQAQGSLLGASTSDVFLNADAYWRNVPETVWSFTIGGYQVMKKWLSYREQPLLGRSLSPTEIRYVLDMARRLAALRLMAPELDLNYRACAAAHRPLEAGAPKIEAGADDLLPPQHRPAEIDEAVQ